MSVETEKAKSVNEIIADMYHRNPNVRYDVLTAVQAKYDPQYGLQYDGTPRIIDALCDVLLCDDWLPARMQAAVVLGNLANWYAFSIFSVV